MYSILLMFVTVEETPNPNARKFITQVSFCQGSAVYKADEIIDDGVLAKMPKIVNALLSLGGISEIMLSDNFVTIVKEDGVEWAVLRPPVLKVFMDFFISGNNEIENIVSSPVEAQQSLDLTDNDVLLLKQVIDDYIAPGVAMDGGHISLVSFDKDTGVVKVKLSGACSGCPSSQITLKDGIERMLKHHLPNVKNVEAV